MFVDQNFASSQFDVLGGGDGGVDGDKSFYRL